MELTVLAVAGCPNAAVLEQRLAEALAGQPGVTVKRRVISDAAEAARWGMSPGLLAASAPAGTCSSPGSASTVRRARPPD